MKDGLMRALVWVAVGTIAWAGVAMADYDGGDSGPGHVTPYGVTATCAATSADVSWNAVDDPHLSGYDLYRRSSGESQFRKVNSGTIAGTQHQDAGLSTGVAYEYGVVSVFNDGHTSSMSDLATCTTG